MLYGLNSKLSHTSLTMHAAHSPGGAPLRRQQDQVFGHGAHHAHGRPSEPRRPDCTGSRMALKCPTSSRPCDSSLRGVVTSTTNSLRSTWHLCFPQASGPYNGTCTRCVRAFIFSSIHRLLTYNLGQVYTLLSTQAQRQLYPIEISCDHLMFTQSDTPAASASTSTGRRF